MNAVKKKRTMHTRYIVVIFFLIFGIADLGQSANATEAQLSMQEVSFTTSDNVSICGSWIVPQTSGKSKKRRPAVLLLHDYGLNRRDWGIFIPELIQQGYNVLAIDLRGHGQSGGGQTSSKDLIEAGPLDVQAALKWLKSQKSTDKKRIALIGAGIGADIAYLCSGKFKKQIRATVVISPSYSTITEGNIVQAKPRAILFCVSEKSQRGASMFAIQTLLNFTEDPKKTVVYNSAAHGLAIFYKHPEITHEILGWIAR